MQSAPQEPVVEVAIDDVNLDSGRDELARYAGKARSLQLTLDVRRVEQVDPVERGLPMLVFLTCVVDREG
jgi:hypothetical protein